MNLVAKEYVAAQDAETGVLILSRFAGASQELADAIHINPYDTEALAESIHRALEMPPEQRRARMSRMRAYVREHNIYRWAGNLITELASLRVDEPPYSGSHYDGRLGAAPRVNRSAEDRSPEETEARYAGSWKTRSAKYS